MDKVLSPTPYCPVCESPMGIDRVSLNDARFLTLAFRCDEHEVDNPVTFDGTDGDLDVVLAEVTPLFMGVRQKERQQPVRPFEPIQPWQPVRAGIMIPEG